MEKYGKKNRRKEVVNKIGIKEKCYAIPFVGKRFLRAEREKVGEMYSESLRRWYKLRFNVDIGLYTYGGVFDSEFNTGGEITVGRYCSIAKNVRYFGANHPLEFVSMSPLFYNRKFGYAVKDVPRGHLFIGNDVWIGYGVIITKSCANIGNGAVIGAGSIVTQDVPPYTVVAGNPARVIKTRFSPQIIEQLEASKWWEKSPDELIQHYNELSDPCSFVYAIKESDKNEAK